MHTRPHQCTNPGQSCGSDTVFEHITDTMSSKGAKGRAADVFEHITGTISSKGAKGRAADTGAWDSHWSGVGKGEFFTATFASTDAVGSRTTLPLG